MDYSMKPSLAAFLNRVRSRFRQGKPVAYGNDKALKMPSDDELIAFHDKEWKRLNHHTKVMGGIMLRKLPEWETVADFVRSGFKEHGGMWMHACNGHHGWGMAIRNYLRTGKVIQYTTPAVWAVGDPPHVPTAADHEVVFDSGLPGIKDDQLPSKLWDDYYTQMLEYAAGVREV